MDACDYQSVMNAKVTVRSQSLFLYRHESSWFVEAANCKQAHLKVLKVLLLKKFWRETMTDDDMSNGHVTKRELRRILSAHESLSAKIGVRRQVDCCGTVLW